VADFTARDVQELRKETGAGMMDAKRALTECDGDFDRAKEMLRIKGLADAKKRAGRSTDQGAIGHYLHYQTERPVVGCLIELLCETDFVAKSEDFQQAARDLAMHLAAARPQWITVEDVPDDAIEAERKLIIAQAEEEGKPENVRAKIAEGKLRSYFQDNVLMEQKFVNPEKFDGTVQEMLGDLSAKLGENITVGSMARLAVGEE
jgi:elongation factor Ts